MKYKLSVKNVRIPGAKGKLRCLIIRPKKALPPGPGILWIHGGGYLTGMPDMALFSRAKALAQRFGCTVVAPAYGLSLRHPYPDGLEDCHRALLWLRDNAEALNVRPDQIMVGGESAGGGMTAALCMLARDRRSVRIAFQMPLYPMLDDRDTPSSRDNHAPVWNTKRNHAAWRLYLRRLTGEVPCYAAPARGDGTGLPPAYTFVGDAEPFYCEAQDYVEKLRQAGVPAEIDVYPGCFHAFDMLTPWKPVSRQAAEKFEAAFRQAKERYFAPQEE